MLADELLKGQRLHRSRVVRWLLRLAGTVALGLGLLGVILPGLPTTPFVLLAAACYARASPRLYAWLLANPVFGPLICDWRAYGAVPRRAKWLAILTMAVTVGLSVWTLAGRPWLQAMVVIIVGIVALWLWRRPEPPVLP